MYFIHDYLSKTKSPATAGLTYIKGILKYPLKTELV